MMRKNTVPRVRSEKGEVDAGDVVGTTVFFGIVAAVALGVTHAASSPSTSTDPHEVKSYDSAAVACRQPGQQPPTRLTVANTKDVRSGMLYPCNYFKDLKLPDNVKLPLGKVTSETFDRNVSKAHVDGSIGGFAILASGILSGHLSGSAHSDTVRERLYLVNIKDTDGNYVYTTLDRTNKVRVNRCAPSETCTPSIEFDVAEKPLWYREPGKTQHFPASLPWKSQKRDTTSIWQVDGVHTGDGSDLDGRRTDVVSQFVDRAGDPLPPGQIATTLANEIIMTIPQS